MAIEHSREYLLKSQINQRFFHIKIRLERLIDIKELNVSFINDRRGADSFTDPIQVIYDEIQMIKNQKLKTELLF